MFKSRKKVELLNETLPKAWNKIITDPDESLVVLLIETTEKICGLKPDDVFVIDFLKNKLDISHDTSNQKGSHEQGKKKQSDRYIDDKDQRELGRKGYDQIEHYIIPVIRLIKSGKKHTEVFHEIADKLDVTYQTVSAECTKQLKLSTDEFLEYVKNGQILNLLEKKYPEKKEIFRKELGIFFFLNEYKSGIKKCRSYQCFMESLS